MKEWTLYENGLTIGQTGSENGRILCDEEYQDACRITLEKTRPIPYSITCGIYGFMCHTDFASTEPQAKETYECMKKELKEFIDAGADEASAVEWVEGFVEKW